MKKPDDAPAKAPSFFSGRSRAWFRVFVTFVIAIVAYFAAYVLYAVVFRAPPLATLLGNMSFYLVTAALAAPTEIGVGLAVEVLAASNHYLGLHFRHSTFLVLRSLIGAVFRMGSFWARAVYHPTPFLNQRTKLIRSYIENAIFLTVLAFAEARLSAITAFRRRWPWKHLCRHIGLCLGIILTWPLIYHWRPEEFDKKLGKAIRNRFTRPYTQGSVVNDLVELALIGLDRLTLESHAKNE